MASNFRSALWFPLFDELADPGVFVAIAEQAEAAGWDGVFVWDQIAWTAPVQSVADPWISLAAAAHATEKIRLGAMVTPLARRRPVKLARETASLDRLSGGRLILGVGLGSDAYAAEFTRTGEQVVDRVRAEMFDEALEVIAECWSGRPVRHRGRHYTVHDIAFLPTPVQQPRIPIWAAGRAGRAKPLNRATRVDGFFPVGLQGPNQLAEIAATITRLRPDPTAPYDIAVEMPPTEDPAGYAAAGATWGMTEFDPETMTLDLVRGVLRDGPFRPTLRSEGSQKQETIAAYDASAVEYAAETAKLPDSILKQVERFAGLLGGSGRVLEIGSGGGRDARALEAHGLNVRRTDITPGFVQVLREQGFEADLLDPLTDELSDPHSPGGQHDAIWAQACLMHVDPADLPTVLTRLAEVTRPAGLIFLSVTAGDGHRLETGRTGSRYHQTDWREAQLRAVASNSGWVVDEVWSSQGKTSPFLNVLGHRADAS